MRIFVAGASGVLGRRLVPRLVAAGHRVTAMTRRAERTASLAALGAEPVVCDVYDGERLGRLMGEARPEAVVNQLTRIPPRLHPRRIRRQMAETDRLRGEGGRILLEAARAAGARRLVAQSIAFVYDPAGDGPAGEDEPLYLDAPPAFRDMVRAVARLERTVLSCRDLDGVVLRYGYFYGPGTIYAPDGSFAADVRRRRVPIVGSGGGVFSFVHVDDAASATLRAVESAPPGVYNVVEDEPLPLARWLPGYAESLGARPPWRVPELLGRLAAGPYGIYLMCRQRGARNRTARRTLGWAPEHAFGSANRGAASSGGGGSRPAGAG